MREEVVLSLIQCPALEARLTFLRNSAKKRELRLPTDVALYIAQNVRSNARALEGALVRLMAHSSLTDTQITLKYTQQVLANFIAAEAHNVTVDPLQKLLSQPFGTKEAKIGRQSPTVVDRDFVFWLVTTRDGRTSRVRHELEVNMREGDRERLAGRDAFERESERRAKKQRRG